MIKLIIFLALMFPATLFAGDAGQPADVEIAELRRQMQEAEDAVRKIVNQPVTHLPLDKSLNLSPYKPGWFHPGAIRPDFKTVDVRQYQEFPYAGEKYVTSDITPSEMFLGEELEFNHMTKLFYTDRSVPKKKLTEAEMLEINRLYRIIGEAEGKLVQHKIAEMSVYGEPSFFSTVYGVLSLLMLVATGIMFCLGRWGKNGPPS